MIIFLFTSMSYAQRSPIKDRKAKVERKSTPKVTENANQQQVQGNQQMTVSPVFTGQIRHVNPKLFTAFNAHDYILGNRSMEFKTVSQGFSSNDNSTRTVSSPTKEDGELCTNTILRTNLSSASFKDFTKNGPPDWLKPGIIMNAEMFVQGKEVIEENYNRGSITISSTAPSAPQKSITIDNPKNRSNITVGIANLLSTDNSHVHGANISYAYSEIHSVDELNYKINGRYSNSFFDIAADLGMTSNSKKTHHYYLVEFTQTLFSLEVDGLEKENIFPTNENVDLGKYVYISKVNYGRKGYFMFRTEKSLQDFGVSANVSANYMGHNAAVKSNLEKIASSRSTEVDAFYYGGSVSSAVDDILADWEKQGRRPLEDYIKGYRFSAAEAYPISYEMKNLDNERVGMNSRNSQNIKTCVPINNLKLKVTLVQLQSNVTQDRDQYADLGITQHIQYKANNKYKTPSQKDIRKFPTHTECFPGDERSTWEKSTALICGNKDRQIQASANKNIGTQRTPNINSSLVFEISPEEANDRNAKFTIDTWVKEYSSTDVVLNHDPRKIEVAIHDVLAILTGARPLGETERFKDHSISSNVQLHHFDGLSLPLADVGYNGKIILEGPIRARNKGNALNEKAFVWMRFELID